MLRFASLLLAALFWIWAGAGASGQTSTRSPAVAPEAKAATPQPATPSPTPAPAPGVAAIIDTMGPADLQQAIQLLKNNYINPAALNEAELNRAMLAGVLSRLGRGVVLLAEKTPEVSEATNPFFGEVLDGHIGYLRFGALTAANLQLLDANLQKYRDQKIDAVVIDLRASPATNDFAIAAEFAKRFCAKGKPLFTLRKSAGKPEHVFASDREPAYQGLTIVLADGETAGPAEAIAGVLRWNAKALIIGQPSAGRAVEYSDLPLNGGRILRAAVGEAILPEGRPLFPNGLKPDLPVEMSMAEKKQIFRDSLRSGMSEFVFENERPHLNEAALLAGRNPEIDAIEAAQRSGRNPQKSPPLDLVLQRAVDLVTSLAIYQHH